MQGLKETQRRRRADLFQRLAFRDLDLANSQPGFLHFRIIFFNLGLLRNRLNLSHGTYEVHFRSLKCGDKIFIKFNWTKW